MANQSTTVQDSLDKSTEISFFHDPLQVVCYVDFIGAMLGMLTTRKRRTSRVPERCHFSQIDSWISSNIKEEDVVGCSIIWVCHPHTVVM